jgi:hypothetical protein
VPGLWLALSVSALACAGTGDPAEPAAPPEPAAEGCKAFAATPRSVDEVVELVNELPKPASVACFLEALSGPLALQAANSPFSAQPAAGARSPRLFLFYDPLVLSVVPGGSGAHLLELGERRSDNTSLKAELAFPIESEISRTAPYDRLRFNDTTTTSACGFCHASEHRVEEIDHPFAVISQAMRPLPSQRVTLESLRAEAIRCDPAAEAERCDILRALFDRDTAPLEHEFPATFKTFF